MGKETMRSIDGHFTVINEPGTARVLAANLLQRFESMRSPEHIIITETFILEAAKRSHKVLAQSLTQSIATIEKEIESSNAPSETITYAKIEKAQAGVIEATNHAEKLSTSKNWRKLDRARKHLAKELEKCGFASLTSYVDFVNSQGVGGAQRRELFIARDELIASKKLAENSDKSLSALTPSQIITVLADVLSRAPRTAVGPLPVIFDDALRNVDVSTKLRAMELLKAHSSHYATWYITDDPIVLSWAGFVGEIVTQTHRKSDEIFDIDREIAS